MLTIIREYSLQNNLKIFILAMHTTQIRRTVKPSVVFGNNFDTSRTAILGIELVLVWEVEHSKAWFRSDLKI